MATFLTLKARGGLVRKRRRALLACALLAPMGSCVPEARGLQSAGSSVPVLAIELPALTTEVFAPPALPLSLSPIPAAAATVFRAGSGADQLRALDCLAQAVYYEARSESEEGQRAVAQIVLNRVRHPAYPASVCGVVYQGPMKAGGGCQFAFTCDGALARRPVEPGWSQARRIAAEALAGRVYRPVGLSTHYHNFSMMPHWAAGLTRTAIIGAHIFYRWTGAAGRPAAFDQPYAGREPGRAFAAAAPAPVYPALVPVPAPVPVAYAAVEAPPPLPADRLPQSTVRPEYRDSGTWIADPR